VRYRGRRERKKKNRGHQELGQSGGERHWELSNPQREKKAKFDWPGNATKKAEVEKPREQQIKGELSGKSLGLEGKRK